MGDGEAAAAYDHDMIPDGHDPVVNPTLAELRLELEVSEAEVDAGLTVPMSAVLAELRAEIEQMEGRRPVVIAETTHQA